MGDTSTPSDNEYDNYDDYDDDYDAPPTTGIGLGDQDTENKLQFIERLQAIGVSKYIALPQVS